MVKSRKVIFRKSQILLATDVAYSKHSIAIDSISMAGCINAVWAIVCFEIPAREASIFCDFWKLTSCNFIALISTFIEVNLLLCLLRINLPNLCPNMNHFDAADFSEWHSEEVISFFWRSVYISKISWNNISSVESQKGPITIHRCSIENHKGTIAINIVQW